MKRIVYLTQQFPVVTETFTLNEVMGLRSRGLEVTVRALRPAPETLPPSLEPLRFGAEVVTLRPTLCGARYALSPATIRRPRSRALAALRGGAIASTLNPVHDHVHAQFPLGASTAGLFAARGSGASFSFSGHTYHQLDLMPEKLAAAKFVVVGSEYERELLRAGHGAGGNVRVRRLGVPERPVRRSVDRGLVVSVGTLSGKKGHDVLVHAFAELPTATSLVIIGDGPEREALARLARSLGVTDRVSFPGAIGHADALELVGRAEAFVLCCRGTPDGDHDCLPVALMDAMSLGVPCVSSDAFGIPELIENGRSGILCPPGDHLAVAAGVSEILGEPALRDRIGAAGRDGVRERYDLETNLDELAALFESSLS